MATVTTVEACKVRRWGSGAVHYAQARGIVTYRATVFGALAVLAATPVATVCRRVLFDKSGYVIVMQADTAVTCRTCLVLVTER